MCPHQDGTFLYTEPQSCIGFWWPLDDCSEENGCLYAVPGSHVLGVKRRFRRRDPPDDGSTGRLGQRVVDLTYLWPPTVEKYLIVEKDFYFFIEQ